MSTKENRVYEEVIVTHQNADFDALGSMIAASKLYPKAALVFPGGQGKNIRDFFINSTIFVFNFVKPKQIDLEKVKRLIIVDTRQKSRIGVFQEILDRVDIHIYDHHPDSEDDIVGSVNVVEPLGANVSVMTKVLREKGVLLSPLEATIMCLGIHEDTGSFTFSSTTPEDYMAAGWLAQRGIDQNLIADMLARDLSAEQVWILGELLNTAARRFIDGIEVVITNITKEVYIPDFAVLVHKFMEMENLKVVFALAQMEDKVYVVARSRIPEVDVSKILAELGGGGHPYAASAAIKDATLIQVLSTLDSLLPLHIKGVRTAKDIMSAPVISVRPTETIQNAAQILNRYNINVLLVMDEEEELKGYITRQVIEKAIYFGLESAKVQDYMSPDLVFVSPTAQMREVQDLIVKGKLRIVPVVEAGKVLGVITRTDLLQILFSDSTIPEPLYGSEDSVYSQKNIISFLKEQLPPKVLDILHGIGKIGDRLQYNVYLVGGVVRDLILRRPNLDLDVVVEGDATELAQEVGKELGARVKVNKKFKTAITIFPDGLKLDFATARIEYYEAPGAPPIVETSCLKRDMYRRDFTVNTLAVRLNERYFGTLIDYYGGLRDIKDKSIKVLHNLSFVEDPSRILRAVRFEQRFGFKASKLTLSLIKSAVRQNLLKDASGHRLYHELILILKEEDPASLILRLDELDVLPQILGANVRITQEHDGLLQRLNQVVWWYKLLYREDRFESWKVYWFGLLSLLNDEEISNFAIKMGLNDKESIRLIDQIKERNILIRRLHNFSGTNYELRELCQRYDTEFLLFIMAKANTDKIKKLISKYFTKIKDIKPSLTGKDLKAMGLKPGPLYKRILDSLLEARLNESLKSPEEEREFVKNMISSFGY